MSTICNICGGIIDDNDAIYDSVGNAYHRECVRNSDEYSFCVDCDTVYSNEDMEVVTMDNGSTILVCQHCADNYYRCHECGRLYESLTYYDHLDDYYCDNCIDTLTRQGNISQCANCDEIFWDDDLIYDDDSDEYMCRECYDERNHYNDIIRDYHDNPSVQYFPVPADGEKFRGFGIELEVSAGDCPDGSPSELATNLRDLLQDHAYYMHDGSIGDGVEIITQPHTMEEFLKIDWKSVLQFIIDKGYRSHDVRLCGLHMHISRNMFTAESIKRIIYFYEHNISDIIRISRRTNSQMSDWASLYGWGEMTFEELSERYDNLGYLDHSDRYHAVNLTNDNTIEFRLMRGTLNYDTFMATIDFLWTTAMNAIKMSDDDVTDPANFLKGLKPATVAYIMRRNAFKGVYGE